MAKVKKDYRKKTLNEEISVLDVAVDKSSLSVKETRKLFKRGNAALNANNYPLAAKNFFKAWEADPDNLGLLTVVSHILAKLGHQAVAIEFLEKAVALHGLTEDICKVMGEMALSLEMFEAAEKIFAQAVQFNSQEEKYYINIATALEGQGNADGAIQFMEEVVKILNESSDCWCYLGALYKDQKAGTKMALAFERALLFNPENFVAMNNYARGLGLTPKVKELAERAIQVAPDVAEPHILLSNYLLYGGDLSAAWEHYEFRNDPSRGPLQTVQYTHDIRIWSGQPVYGKTIFIAAEQGIGDEIYFSQAFHKLIDDGAKLVIGCDKRLVHIFERSYPGVKAFAYKDAVKSGVRYRYFPEFDALKKSGTLKVDYSLAIGSIPLHYWKNVLNVKQFPDGYLRADDAEISKWKRELESLGNKPKIGLSWRSGHIEKSRVGHYVGLENLIPLIAEVDADFICLQYGYTQDELDEVKSKTGKSLCVWPEIDLKNDLEANLAIMSNLDMVLGPGIATQMLSLASGTETWQLGCRPWWAWEMTGDNSIYHSPKSSYWEPATRAGGDLMWADLVAKVVEAIKKKL